MKIRSIFDIYSFFYTSSDSENNIQYCISSKKVIARIRSLSRYEYQQCTHRYEPYKARCSNLSSKSIVCGIGFMRPNESRRGSLRGLLTRHRTKQRHDTKIAATILPHSLVKIFAFCGSNYHRAHPADVIAFFNLRELPRQDDLMGSSGEPMSSRVIQRKVTRLN